MTPNAITRHDIEACTSERLLRLWHARLHAADDELVAEIQAGRLVGWPPHKFAYQEREVKRIRIQMRDIERRALALGFEPILQRKHHHQEVIERYRAMKAEKERLEAELAALRMGRAA